MQQAQKDQEMILQEVEKYKQKAKRGCPDFHQMVSESDAFRLHKFRDLHGVNHQHTNQKPGNHNQSTSPAVSSTIHAVNIPSSSKKDDPSGGQLTPVRDRASSNNARAQMQVCGGVIAGNSNAVNGSASARQAVIGGGASSAAPGHTIHSVITQSVHAPEHVSANIPGIVGYM